jgi:hypothetical protein
MANRLPKQFWRVSVVEGAEKLRVYQLGSKTYAALAHAESQLESLRKRGLRVELWTTGPVTWELVSADVKIEGQEELF